MDAAFLGELRDRLDRLSLDEAEAPGIWERMTVRGEVALPETPKLDTLSTAFRQAGIHTLADARFLAGLAQRSSRAEAIGTALRQRVRDASREVELHIAALEKRKRLGQRVGSVELDRAEARRTELARGLEVVELLSQPRTPRDTDYRPIASRADHRPAVSPMLATAELYLRRAQAEAIDVRRKRRHLDLAQQLLLGLSAEVEADRDRAQEVRRAVVREGERTRRLEASVRPGETLPGAVSRLISQQEGQQAWRGIVDAYRSALEAGSGEEAAPLREALEALEGGFAEPASQATAGNAERTFAERLGPGALAAVWRERGRPTFEADPLLETAYELDASRFELFDLAVTSGAFFQAAAVEEQEAVESDAGGAAAEPVKRTRVPWPTAEMEFETTSRLSDLRNFVITDPRLVMHAVASGQQLARAYFEVEAKPKRKSRRSAVRVYVCDASGSMRGPRARFRDAVLVAELNNLSLRVRNKQEVWPLYFSFFSDVPTELTRVDTAGGAHDAIARLFDQSPAQGKTDISFALESAFDAIRHARRNDPDLARATVVLITDGEDDVNAGRLRRARAPVGDVEITLNFISLGQENAALRQIVLEQRESGRRSFYTHLSDRELVAGPTRSDDGVRTLLPELPLMALGADDPGVKVALAALERLAHGRETVRGEELSPATRFEAWFGAIELAPRRPAPAEEGLRAHDLLGAVADALAITPDAERESEAVVLIEHLCGQQGWRVERWQAARLVAGEEGRRLVDRIRRLGGRPALEHDAPSANASGGRGS